MVVIGKLRVRSLPIRYGTPTYFDACARDTVIASVIMSRVWAHTYNGTAFSDVADGFTMSNSAVPGVLAPGKFGRRSGRLVLQSALRGSPSSGSELSVRQRRWTAPHPSRKWLISYSPRQRHDAGCGA
jgi:hypothetical protein